MKKLRGKKRFLRRFQQNLELLKNYRPECEDGYQYWNCKIGIHRGLLHIRPSLTRNILNQYLASATDLFKQTKESSRRDTVVLLSEYFASEV